MAEEAVGAAAGIDLERATQPYVGQWQRLVSTTNWEKGRIVCQWRDALVAQGAPASEWSDEAWSRAVQNVSPQHVGRLRRVYRRFGPVVATYEGLFWSHFNAVLDWTDAEMWLEGAVQNRWSVAAMRDQRQRTLGGAEASGPDPDELLSESWDGQQDAPCDSVPARVSAEIADVRTPLESAAAVAPAAVTAAAPAGREQGDQPPHATARERPFEDLPDLPEELAEKVDDLKVAILQHRLAGWQETTPDDIVAHLDALRQLTLAPA